MGSLPELEALSRALGQAVRAVLVVCPKTSSRTCSRPRSRGRGDAARQRLAIYLHGERIVDAKQTRAVPTPPIVSEDDSIQWALLINPSQRLR
jgi:hypothetical protein